MKRVLAVIIALLLTVMPCLSEQNVIGYDILSAVAMCPSAATFDYAPSPIFAGEAVCAYRVLHPDADVTDDEICALIFANFEGIETDLGLELIPAAFEIENTLIQPDGIVLHSVRVLQDFGDGLEFSYFANFYFEPESGLLTRIFFPE